MRRISIIVLSLWASLLQAEIFYDSRPHISETELVSTPAQIASKQLLSSMINFIIELRLLYPNKRRVYLGRDGEILYDIDWLLWEHLDKDKTRNYEPILINVSRKNIKHKDLIPYLKRWNLATGTPPPTIVVDTGYEGSIINRLNEIFKSHGYKKIRAHLISSAHPKSPSSRASTQAYLSREWTSDRFTKEFKEPFLDEIDKQIEQIEGLAHYTDTSTSFGKNAKDEWDAVSFPTSPQEQTDSIELQKQVKHFVLKKNTISFAQHLIFQIGPLVHALYETDLTAEKIDTAYQAAEKSGFSLFWWDLREAFAMHVFEANPHKMTELWKQLPFGRPAFFDLEPDQLSELLRREKDRYGEKGIPYPTDIGSTQEEEPTKKDLPAKKEEPPKKEKTPAPKTESGRLLIEEIMDYHAYEKQSGILALRDDLRLKHRKKLQESGKLKEFIDEGVRAAVHDYEEGKIIKLPFEADDMRYIAVEALVQKFLEKNYERYQIKTLPILEEGELGLYLVRQKLSKETLGRKVSKGNLSDQQIKRLKVLFNNVRKFAAETGVGLDPKYDNVAWIQDDWVLFDVGPRTSYGPYAFSLDLPNFETFYRLWKDDRPRQNGLPIEEVIRKHREKPDCAAELLLSR